MPDLFYACEEMMPLLRKIAPPEQIVDITWGRLFVYSVHYGAGVLLFEFDAMIELLEVRCII
jgi:hypothetical protein